MSEIPPCEAILFRAARSAQCQGSEACSEEGFYLYEKDHSTGLSYQDTTCKAKYSLKKIRRVISHHAGKLRDCGLEWKPDEAEPGHFYLLGLPKYNPAPGGMTDEDRRLAERLAIRLSRMARIAWQDGQPLPCDCDHQ